jgi:guanylate kinase
VPDLAEQDDRRPVATPARGAGQPLPQVTPPPDPDSSAAGRLFVITGPSGVGKGTLIRRLLDRVPGLELSVSATTRPPRPGEKDGVDYHFKSAEEFDRLAREGQLLEHATYSGRRYGTPRSEVEPRLEAGRSVVLEIEVQGARQVREAMPEAVQVFIAPPSPDALRARLEGRATDRPEEIERRLEAAEQELAAREEFGHVIVNDDLERAAEELIGLVRDIVEPGSPAQALPEGERP